MSLFDLTGEVAVVLGATGVLGGAIAEGLAAAAPRWPCWAATLERGEARVRSIQQQGGDAGFFSADALDQNSLKAASRGFVEPVGRSHHSGERRGWQ